MHDISGWTMPSRFQRSLLSTLDDGIKLTPSALLAFTANFWSDYKFEVPEELAGVCRPTDPSTIPVGLRGATIR